MKHFRHSPVSSCVREREREKGGCVTGWEREKGGGGSESASASVCQL